MLEIRSATARGTLMAMQRIIETAGRAIDAGTMPALVSAAAVCAAGMILLPLYGFGPLSSHMLLHIATMNAAAPLLAAALSRMSRLHDTTVVSLWCATIVQLAVLWIWHLPSAQHAAAAAPLVSAAMHVSLFGAALWFWWSLTGLRSDRRWHGVLVLLITGKMACLLAGLLVFAPRAIYAHQHGAQAVSPLDDQHLAGLLMLVACPLSYVLAGIVLAARILGLSRSISVQTPAS
jgi:putative membrane protein